MRARRVELGLTQKEVADAVGVSSGTISRWESGEIANMGSGRVAALAEVLHIAAGDITGAVRAAPGTVALAGDSARFADTRRIPVLGRISAGLPLYAEEHIEGYTYTDLDGGHEYFALRVQGDSMDAARIRDGDTVIVQKQDMVANGEIAVVRVDGESATIKRFYQQGNTVTLMPQSTNPSHQPQMYHLGRVDIRVLGKVVRNQIELG